MNFVFFFEESTRQHFNALLRFFEVLALHLLLNHTLRTENSKVFNVFITTVEISKPNHFKGVQMNDFPIVQDLMRLNILLRETDLVDRKFIVAVARRSVQNYKNTVRLRRYNNHICYVSKISAVCQSFRCPSCDNFFYKRTILEKNGPRSVNG